MSNAHEEAARQAELLAADEYARLPEFGRRVLCRLGERRSFAPGSAVERSRATSGVPSFSLSFPGVR